MKGKYFYFPSLNIFSIMQSIHYAYTYIFLGRSRHTFAKVNFKLMQDKLLWQNRRFIHNGPHDGIDVLLATDIKGTNYLYNFNYYLQFIARLYAEIIIRDPINFGCNIGIRFMTTITLKRSPDHQ